MLGGGQNAGTSWERFWKELPYGFKRILILTIAIGLVSIITNLFLYLFGNIYSFTVSKLQLWRLFTSFLVDASIINVIFSLYLMSSSAPQIEKRYSTVYFFVEIFIQSALCNIGFTLIEFILSTLSLVNPTFSYCLGLTPLMFIFLWKRVAQNPDQSTKFCFFPCLMPQKYLPWSFLALTLMFGVGLSSVVACCLGYYQEMVLKRSLIRIPLSFYRKFQRCFPKSVRDNSTFTQTSGVQNALRTVCYSPSEARSSPRQQRNPYEREQPNNNDAGVAASGAGVSIGSSSRSSPSNSNIPDFRRHWLQDEVEQRIPAVPTFVTDQPSQEPFKIQSQHNQTMVSDYPFVDMEDQIEQRRVEQKK